MIRGNAIVWPVWQTAAPIRTLQGPQTSRTSVCGDVMGLGIHPESHWWQSLMFQTVKEYIHIVWYCLIQWE